MLLDFQAAVPKRSERIYTLEYGSMVEREEFGTTLVVNESPDTATIDTGRLRIEIDKARFAPFGEVALDGRPYLTGSRIVVNGTGGERYVSTNAAPDTVEIEEAGPLHCVVRTEGSHRSADGQTMFKSICRIHAYAGLPYLRLDHTFVNENTERVFSEIASMYLELDTPSGDHREDRDGPDARRSVPD